MKTKSKVKAKDLQSKNLDDFLEDWSNDEASKESNEVSEDEEVGDKATGASDQKKYLSSLQDKDPEFYKFLKENDQELLNFDESSDDEQEDLEPIHKLPQSLQVASDEEEEDSDDEDPDEEIKTSKLSKKSIEEWKKQLEKNPNIQVVSKVVSAFKSALTNIAEGGKPKELMSDNGTVFNNLMNLCLTQLEPSLNHILKAKKVSDLSKSKNWRPMNKWLKIYTTELCKFVTAISEVSVLSAILKHIHSLVLYFAALPKSIKSLVKTIIGIWSTHPEESVRVLALMIIIRCTKHTEGQTFELICKNMYMAYIRNAKFTSPNTWPMIHFMRRSLAQIFALNPALAYKHAFVYIRQLTIHLRNAMMNTDVKNLQTVYNWQFVHSIHLWIQLLGSDEKSDILEPLIYPLVQLTIGTIRLNYTSKYYPLRFHLCQLLNQLSVHSGKYIPILPYYLDILQQYNFGKKGPKLSMKPMDFSCVLRLSKSQLSENGFKDATIEAIHLGLLQTLANLSHKICFPELAVPALAQLRNFLKTCKVANYSKKMKSIKEKVEENAIFMQKARCKVTFGVKDLQEIQTFEAQIQAKGTPLTKYFDTFKSIKEAEKAKKVKKDMDADYKFIPEFKAKKKEDKSPEEFKGIFGDEESSDEEADQDRFQLKEERGKKRQKKEAKEAAKKPAKKAKKEESSESGSDNQDDKSESESSDEEGDEDLVEDFDDFSE